MQNYPIYIITKNSDQTHRPKWSTFWREPTRGNQLQVSSYYKMRSHFFVPRPSIEETTGPNWMKFCMEHPRGIIRGITEGFLDIQSGGQDIQYPWGPKGRPKILKFLLLIFFTFLTVMGFWRSKSLVKVIIGPSYHHFEWFLSSWIIRKEHPLNLSSPLYIKNGRLEG